MNETVRKAIFLSSNIKFLRNLYRKTQQDIADLCEKQNTAVANWEKGIRLPDIVDLAILSNFFKISINDLMFKDLRFDNESSNITSQITKIPIYDAIDPTKAIEKQTNIIDYIYISKTIPKNNQKFYGLKLQDDSMCPKYQQDDIIIFEQNSNLDICNNKDCAIIIDNKEFTFKKLLINKQNIVLQPYNSNHNLMIYTKEQIQVIGIAKEKITKLD